MKMIAKDGQYYNTIDQVKSANKRDEQQEKQNHVEKMKILKLCDEVGLQIGYYEKLLEYLLNKNSKKFLSLPKKLKLKSLRKKKYVIRRKN